MSTNHEPTYWCHQCSRSLTNVRLNGGNEILCPLCNGGFVEENLGFPQDQRAFRGFSAHEGRNPGIFQVMELVSAALQRMNDDPEHVTPMLVLPGLFGGGNLEIMLQLGSGGGGRRLPANLGDYFLGPGLEQLIQQLAENDPNKFGTPPASKSAIDAMPIIRVSKEQMGTDAATCAVCKDEFELGAKVREMPCKHLYHEGCILPWLQQHNSCPVCRYEVPTDDPEYEQARATRITPSGAAAASGSGALSMSPDSDYSSSRSSTRPSPAEGSQDGRRRRSMLSSLWHSAFPFRFSNSPSPTAEASGSRDRQQDSDGDSDEGSD